MLKQQVITKEAIAALDYIPRANLINSITGYKSANLLATANVQGQTNVAIFSSVTHFGSNPPIVGHVTRPNTVARHTYDNIKKTGFYTINHVHQDWIDEAHHTSAKYPSTISEFDQTALTAVYKADFPAPYVAEAVIQLGMKFLQEVPIEVNGTILMLGEIQEIRVPEGLVGADGMVDLNGAQTVTITGLDSYHLPQLLKRLAYARPKSTEN